MSDQLEAVNANILLPLVRQVTKPPTLRALGEWTWNPIQGGAGKGYRGCAAGWNKLRRLCPFCHKIWSTLGRSELIHSMWLKNYSSCGLSVIFIFRF